MKTQRIIQASLLPAGLVLALIVGLGFWPENPFGAGPWPSAAGEKENPFGVISALKGHTDLVYSVALSEDGKLLATGSFDNTIKLWETATGKEIRTFGGPAGHQKQVLSVAISPNGQLLASGSADNSLKVWDIPSTTPLQTLANNDGVTALALSPDGKKLATAGKDGLVQVWDAATFKPLLKLPGHAGPVTGIAFSANGQFIASSGSDKSLRFWNATSGQPISDVGAHAGGVNAVVLHPNNTTAYSVGDDGLLKFWQVPPAPSRPLPGHAGPVAALAFSPDGTQVFTAGSDKIIRQSPLASGKETRSFTGANSAIRSVSVNPNGTLLAAGATENNLLLWNAADGKIVEQLPAHRGSVNGVGFNPQNTQLLTAASDGLLKLWGLPLVPARSLAHPEAVLSAAATPDGKQLFTGSSDKVLRSWDMAKNAVLRQYTGHAGPVTAVTVSGNGQTLVSGSADQTIRFWNQSMGKEAAILGAHAGPVTALALNAAGNQLLSTAADGTVKVWQIPVAAPRPFVHPDQVTCLAVSPDGSKLVTGCGDKLVRLWNFKTGAKEREFPGHTLAITAVAFSGNGQHMAAASANKSLSVWNTGDGKEIKKIPMVAVVRALAFHPDGKSLAAALADNSVRIINLPDGKEAKNLSAHKGAVMGLAYLPKGEALVSGSEDKTVIVWDLKDGSAAKKMEHAGPISSLALSKDGARVAAAAEKSIKVWSLGDGKEILAFTSPAEVQGLAISPDSQRLLLGGKDKLARLHDMQGKLLEFFVHDGPVQAVAFVDARQILTGSADKLARALTSSLVWHKDLRSPRAIFSPKGDQVIAAEGKTVKFFNSADGKDIKSIEAHDEVTAFDLNGDGTKLVTAGADKTIKIWTAKEDKKPLSLLTLDAVPRVISLSPSGTRLAVASGDEKSPLIRVFDVDQGRELQWFSDHTGPIQSLAFLGDNRTFVSTSQDKTARLATVGVLAAIDAHKDGVVGVQFHSNGTQAVSAGEDKTVKLWDLTKGAVLKTFGPVEDGIKAVAFSRDFTQVGAAAGKKALVWNVADGKLLYELAHPALVLSLNFNLDKTRLATGAADKLARVWDVATAKEMQFFANEDAVPAVLFDAKSTGLVFAGGKTPRADTLAIIRVVAVAPGPVTALTMAPNATHVLTGGSDKQVKLWNINNGAAERTYAGFGDAVQALAMAKNNILLAAAGADKVVRLFNFGDAKELGSVKTAGNVLSLAFSPNSVALAGGSADGAVLTWDVTFVPNQPPPPNFLKPIQSFAHKDQATRLEFAADNATIYSASLDKTVHAWKLASLTPTRNFPQPNNVDSVSFNPAGTQLASGCHDGKLRIFDLVKGAQLREINAHPTANATMIYCVAYSPDGSKILSAGFDNSLKLWDANSGALVKEFKAFKVKDFEKGHQDSVFFAAFSPDGKFIASGSAGLERLIKIWNVADGTVVRDLVNPQLAAANPKAPPRSHPGWIYKLRFTKDGKYLVSVGDAPMNKGYLAVWNPSDGKLLYGAALPLGSFFGLAIFPDERLAIGAGPRGKASPEFNSAYLLKWPVQQK